MLRAPRNLIARYLYGAAMPPEEEGLLDTDISDANLAEAMAEPQAADPMAELRRRYLAAQQQGQEDAAMNRTGARFSTLASNLGRNLGLSSTPLVRERDGLEDAPVRALERQLSTERAAAPTPQPQGPRGSASAASRPMKSTDPLSQQSKPYQDALRARFPDAPDALIGAVTEENFESFRKTLEAGARLSQQRASMEAWNTRSTLSREQQAEQFAQRMGLDWAKLSQEERLAAARLAEAQAARGSKEQEKKDALVVPDAEPLPDAKPTPADAEKVKAVLGSEKKMANGIARMRQLHKQYGTEKGGKGGMWLSQAMTGLRLEAKNIADLGALSGPDQGLMESLAGDDPTAAWNNVKAFFGQDNTEAALQGLEAWMEGQVRGTLEARGYRRKIQPKRTPAAQVLPTDASGQPTLDTPAGSVRVLINGKPMPRTVPREKLEALKQKAAANGDKVEVQDG